MNPIEAEAAEAMAKGATWFASHLPHRHPSTQAEPSGSSQQENTMTTPQQPQRNIFASIATALSEVAANPLMVRLASERLGELLEPDDLDHIIGIVRKLEQPSLRAAANVQPQFTPLIDQGASTPFPADGQHGQ